MLGDSGAGGLCVADVMGKVPLPGSRGVRPERPRKTMSPEPKGTGAVVTTDADETLELEQEDSDSDVESEEERSELLYKQRRTIAAAKTRQAKSLVRRLLKKTKRLLWKGQVES